MKIALCGPRGEEKEGLFNHVRSLGAFNVVEDPKAYLVKLQESPLINFDESGQDWLNLWTAITRRIEVIRVGELLGNNADILTDTWALDDLMLQSVWLAAQVEKIQNTPQMVGPDGNPLMPKQQAFANRSGSIVQTLLNQAEEEIIDVYDFIYMKLPFTMDPLVQQYVDFTKSIPAFQNIIELPQLMEEAKDFLTNEAEKWDVEPPIVVDTKGLDDSTHDMLAQLTSTTYTDVNEVTLDLESE